MVIYVEFKYLISLYDAELNCLKTLNQSKRILIFLILKIFKRLHKAVQKYIFLQN